MNSFPNVLTFIEPDVPSTAFVANSCVEGSNGFVSRFQFSKPLIAPIFHFHNLDASRFAITGTSTAGAAIGLTTIVKNNLMDISGTTLNNTVQPATQSGCNNNTASDPINGACGSFRVTAASGLIQTLTLNSNATPPTGTTVGYNDGYSWTVSFPTAPLTKQFSPSTIVGGQTSQLTFTIRNPNESASTTLAPLDFTDNLPAGVTLAAVTATNNGSCGSPSVTNGSGGALAVGATSVRATNISVAPGATCTITVSVTATEVGSYTNAASNMSSSVGNLIPTGSTTLTVTEPAEPGLTIVKTGTLNDSDGDGLLDPGETISYSFQVRNTGNVTLTGVTVNDPLLANAGIAVSPGPQTLAPGGTATFTATYTPTQADIDAGRVENTATGTGTPPSGPPIESPPDTAVVPPQPARLSLHKSGRYTDVDGNGHASVGDTLTFTFAVTNDGGQTVTNVWPIDAGPTFNGQDAAGSLSRFVPEPVTLRPGERATFTATYTLTERDIENAAGVADGISNSATARGTVRSGDVTSDPSKTVITMPAAAPGDITVTKIANVRRLHRGEQAPFTIRVKNNAPTRAVGLTVVDTMPSGFRFVEGSASVAGKKVTPQVAGRQIRFENLSVAGHGEIEIRLRLLALSSAGPGEHVNRAHAEGATGTRISGEARAVVEIIVEPVFDCGDIIGKVFDDRNRNGYQDEGEPGLPGVRVATVKGWLVTTDAYGRFHVACAALPDSRIGSNFIMKLDERTLPTGYRLTTENPRVVRLTAGKMTELNFGAAIGRVVRLDLRDEAFVPGGLELAERWASGIDRLIAELAVEESVLRLAYIDATGDPERAKARLRHIKELIAERWRAQQRAYPLNIETRVEAEQ